MNSHTRIYSLITLLLLILVGNSLFLFGCVDRRDARIAFSREVSSKSGINLNTADQNELQALPGIGHSRARQIIEFRNEYGAFRRKEDLLLVSGIGEKRFESIASLVYVDGKGEN